MLLNADYEFSLQRTHECGRTGFKNMTHHMAKTKHEVSKLLSIHL